MKRAYAFMSAVFDYCREVINAVTSVVLVSLRWFDESSGVRKDDCNFMVGYKSIINIDYEIPH